MSQSLAKVFLHIVFSTKGRRLMILPNMEKQLYGYIWGVCKNCGCILHQIGGVEDHLHMLLELARDVSIAKIVEAIKTSSTKWIKNHYSHFKHFAWQKGYGVFSVDQTMYQQVKRYIANQKQHHSKVGFKEEFLQLLKQSDAN